MKKQFWLDRWAERRIGFHLPDVNPHLRRHWRHLEIPSGAEVLVPLCGKSLDMLWLREQGYRVLGVELSDIALEDFARENLLRPDWVEEGGFRRAAWENLTLLHGDFFHLALEQTRNVQAVYDRAALVALPEEMRKVYARKMACLLQPGTALLLVSMDYPGEQMNGPPFNVSEAEIESLYGDSFDVRLRESVDILARNPQLADKGITRMCEQIWVMRRS